MDETPSSSVTHAEWYDIHSSTNRTTHFNGSIPVVSKYLIEE